MAFWKILHTKILFTIKFSLNEFLFGVPRNGSLNAITKFDLFDFDLAKMFKRSRYSEHSNGTFSNLNGALKSNPHNFPGIPVNKHTNHQAKTVQYFCAEERWWLATVFCIKNKNNTQTPSNTIKRTRRSSVLDKFKLCSSMNCRSIGC